MAAMAFAIPTVILLNTRRMGRVREPVRERGFTWKPSR